MIRVFACTMATLCLMLAVASSSALQRSRPKPKQAPLTRRATPMKHVLCEFSTALVASERSRNSNVRLSAARVDGIVLRPGQTFSLNAIVGARTEAAGFDDAPTLTDLGTVAGMGGGVCQVAGTVYNAALLANMDIVERHPHGSPVRYLDAGRDATVSPVDDLKFSNSLDQPVRITLRVAGARLICGIESAHSPRSNVRIAVSTRRLPDGNLLTRTDRIVTLNGAETRERVSEDTYALPHGH